MAKIVLAQNAGFCSGVDTAYKKAESLAKSGENVFTFGSLIHNDEAISKLNSLGVKIAKSIDDVKAGDTVIIRTHGVSQEIFESLINKGAKVVDATCPFVKKIQNIVKEHADKGYQILIAGDRNHAEVVALNSYAQNKAIIFSDNLPKLYDDEKYCLVFQSTFSQKLCQNIIAEVEKLSKESHKTVVYFDTICYTTKSRQEEAEHLAAICDCVVVVGSKNSANSLRLVEIAKKHNSNVFFIEVADGLPFDIKQFKSIAVISGASTPKWLLEEVVFRMSETQKDIVAEAQSVTQETKVKKAATSLETKEKALTMEDIIDDKSALGFTNYTPGKRVKGKVISADDTGIRVALGGKKDGFIAKEDATIDGNYDSKNFKVGEDIEAQIVSQNKDAVILSKKEVDLKKIENEEAEKSLSQEVFELVMTEVVKGGLRAKMGAYTVFVPASQIKMGYVQNLEEYKGKKLKLTAMPPKDKGEDEAQEEGSKKKSRYIFASQRMVLEKEKKEREDAFWNSIHIHDIVEGKVKRFTPIGAFVNVKGYDCLCHISEISWNNISDPAEVLTINEKYDFVILKMDREAGKISLGYKQLQKKPYEIAADKYPVGTIVKGKIARIKSYGAFVQIEEGVDGLVHVSQIAHNWIKDANEVFKVGQEVEAKIIGFEGNRITLSIKELLPAPEIVETAKADEEEFVEKAPQKRPSRVKKFEESVAVSKTIERKPKKETTSEPKEWITNSGSATLGDLLGNLGLKFDEEEPKPKKTKKVAAEKTE